ncbi:MAG: DUF5683 domain-containing protein [Bacteroidota bacterium]
MCAFESKQWVSFGNISPVKIATGLFLAFCFLSMSAEAQKNSPPPADFRVDTNASKPIRGVLSPDSNGRKIENNTVVTADKVIESPGTPAGVFQPSPKRAAILSAVLPGLGQIYNRKYWKLPILYGGIAALGYFIQVNNDNYFHYRRAYILYGRPVDENMKRLQDRYLPAGLSNRRNYWRRNRDLLIIVAALTYVLNIADATVDAHLRNFNVNDDLQMAISPSVDYLNQQPTAGLSLTFSFK